MGTPSNERNEADYEYLLQVLSEQESSKQTTTELKATYHKQLEEADKVLYEKRIELDALETQQRDAQDEIYYSLSTTNDNTKNELKQDIYSLLHELDEAKKEPAKHVAYFIKELENIAEEYMNIKHEYSPENLREKKAKIEDNKDDLLIEQENIRKNIEAMQATLHQFEGRKTATADDVFEGIDPALYSEYSLKFYMTRNESIKKQIAELKLIIEELETPKI